VLSAAVFCEEGIQNLCPATISASIMAANMWKNSLKNVESDNNKILRETLLDFLQRNGAYFLNKPRNIFCVYVCVPEHFCAAIVFQFKRYWHFILRSFRFLFPPIRSEFEAVFGVLNSHQLYVYLHLFNSSHCLSFNTFTCTHASFPFVVALCSLSVALIGDC